MTAVAFAGLPTNSRHETKPPEFRLRTARREQAIAAGRPLVVMELFTSQGCSLCPSANANLIKLSGAQMC